MYIEILDIIVFVFFCRTRISLFRFGNLTPNNNTQIHEYIHYLFIIELNAISCHFSDINRYNLFYVVIRNPLFSFSKFKSTPGKGNNYLNDEVNYLKYNTSHTHNMVHGRR